MHQLMIHPDVKKGTIAPEIYGQFSEHLGRCIYEGIYVGENSEIPNVHGMRTDVVEALKELHVPVLRWPGGCFADEYHWMDGIGDKSKRKKMINTHWGGVVEDNSFGTHEFFELCEQIGAQPYINGNLGSGTVQEMSEWVEYMTFDGVSPMAQLRAENGREKPWKVKYFGVGNENWGCGGNMTPEFYGNMYRRYNTYCRNYGENKLFRIACGPNVDDYHWMEEVLKVAHPFMDGISLHYYTHPGGWELKSPATGFGEESWYETLGRTLYMETLIQRHTALMDKYDPQGRIGLIIDEWGTWYQVEPGTNPGFLYQQNTMRDALVAGINLNLFHQHCDRVKMANIAQMVNVLQAMILTDGAKVIKTPTYHVFHMFQKHMGGELLESSMDSTLIGTKEYPVPDVTQSVSMANDGTITVSINNLSATETNEVKISFGESKAGKVQGTILCGDYNAYNTFEHPDTVVPKNYIDYKIEDGCVLCKLPKSSVLTLSVEMA